MQCKYCGSEWRTRGAFSQENKCPFCGKELNLPLAQDETFDYVLKSIFERFGYELLLDKHKFISVFSDLAPKMKSERKILTVALDQDIAHLFINTSVSKRESHVRQSVRELQIIMSREAIYTVISSLILALDWDDKLIDLLPKAQSSQLDERTPKQSPKVVDIESLPAKTPVNGNVKEETIEIQGITFFSNDGNMQHPTVECDAFLQGHAQYIGIKVWIKTIQNDIDTELHWTIYKENGSTYSKENILPLHLQKGNDHAYHSWGWATSGNWAAGKYKVVAYFKDKTAPYTAYFTVYPGYYATVKKIKGVRLFAGSDVVPAQNVREYVTIYYASSLRRLYFEFEFRKIKKATYTCMQIKIYDPNNKIFANYLAPIQLEKGYEFCWDGWGWSEPGNWKKGRYTYEVSLYGSNILAGNFDIL